MGHQFTIESDEAYALATELAALEGQSVGAVVTAALRARVEKERERQAELRKMMVIVEEFRALFGDDPPSSNHDWLYDDDTGLPA